MTTELAALTRRINGLPELPKQTSMYLEVGDLDQLRAFGRKIERDYLRRQFANPPGRPPKKPKPGREVNPVLNVGTTGTYGQAMGRWDDLPQRIRKKMRKDPQIALGMAA